VNRNAQDFSERVKARRAHVTFMKGRRPPMRKKIPRQTRPDGIARTYLKRLRATVLPAMLELVQRRLVPRLAGLVEANARAHPIVQDEERDDDINELVDSMSEEFFSSWDNDRFSDVVRPIAETTSDFQRDQFGKQLQAAVGVDVLRAEPWLKPAVDAFTRENVALIKSIPQQWFSDLEKNLARGITAGERPEALQQTIQDRYGVAENRAALIARDQTTKFFGALNEKRQTALGVTSYVWRTSEDERVRPEHAERDGEEFDWKDPPEDGNPGEPINCRCFAEPVLDDILEDL
jgi:SPP1 gp7 family putative phage head morphogenesis protein